MANARKSFSQPTFDRVNIVLARQGGNVSSGASSNGQHLPRHRFRMRLAAALAVVMAVPLSGQLPDAKQVAQERRQAEFELPQLVKVLGLKPGMTVADVGAGFGATTVVLGKWIWPGRVFATDLGERQLIAIRDYLKQEGLSNVVVLEGAAATTNACTNRQDCRPDHERASGKHCLTGAVDAVTQLPPLHDWDTEFEVGTQC